MPTKHVSAEVMSPGGQEGGKHWTKVEIESRQAAEEMVKRKTRVSLRAPDWLSEEALAVWKKTRKQAAGLDLLDNLDAEMLAVYCDAVVQYRTSVAQLRDVDHPVKDRDKAVQRCQSWARLISSYAEKLGFTPTGRARLVKKRADDLAKDKFGDEFD